MSYLKKQVLIHMKFGATLLDAQVELNPHQVKAALFVFKSSFSKGDILEDVF